MEKKDAKPANMPDEAGDIGDEQMPAGAQKTDKEEWNYAADKVKKEPILPEKVRKFLNGL